MNTPAASTFQTAYIGLGANLGEAAATLRQVASELSAHPALRDLTLSPLYRSAPVDAGGPDYVNAVARVQTALAPLALLDLLQDMEQRHGRERPFYHAPRTLDLDLLLHGDTVMHTPRLTVPHAAMHERAFVLRPLQDLAPALSLLGHPLSHWLNACADQRIERLAP